MINAIKNKAFVASLLGMLVFWACHLNDATGDTKFNLTPDSAWAECDFLLVELTDTTGAVIDTLFNDSLKSLDQLNGLDASKYQGGRASVHISGTVNGNVCIEQSRTFDDQGGAVRIDTISLPGTAPKSLKIAPSSLTLKPGDSAVEIQALILPAFADQVFEWEVDDPSVATLDLRVGINDGRAFVKPLKIGETKIKAKAKLDPTIVGEVVVKVESAGGKSISLSPDTLDLFLGGPDSVFTAVITPIDSKDPIEWSSSDETIATVDTEGRVQGRSAGSAKITAKFGSVFAVGLVVVKRDAPVLSVFSKPGAAVNAPITFSLKASQQFGAIVMFKFDLQGDGNWDDSLPGPFLGSTADLPPQTTSFGKEGKFKVRFLVRDTEGNETVAEAFVDIGNQAPETVFKSNDTLVSINDLVPLEAKVRDLEGKVVLVGWDYDNDGKLDDSVKADDSTATIKRERKFAKPGKHVVGLIAFDDAGKAGFDSVRILVVLDPPEADIGPDVSVLAGSAIAFAVKGKDKFGAIAKRELKIGSSDFLNLGKQDTSLVVPGESGSIQVIGRVTDDDGNSDEDTMVVTLLAPSTSNNDLASLLLSAGTLAPEFKPTALFYSLIVAFKDSTLSVTPISADPKATIFVKDALVASGTPSEPVTVPVGTTSKVFEIRVTAQDGQSKLYTVAVTRQPSSDASLANLAPTGFGLKPAFAPTVFDYADTVAFKVASITLKPTASHPSAKISVNDTVVANGTDSKLLNLEVGDNLVKIVVTAQDGKSKSTYTVKIVRKAKVILTRTIGGLTAQVDSLEAPLGTTIGAKAPDSTGFHFAQWTLTEGTGTWLDSTVNPATLTVKSATVRAKAAFEVNVYTITGTIKGFVGGVYNHETIMIQHGMDTTFTITPLVGQRIDSVWANGQELKLGDVKNPFGAKSFKLTSVTKDIKLEAEFFKTYKLSVSSAGANGTISPTGEIEVDSGSSKEFVLTSLSPGTYVWVAAFTDNTVNKTAALGGDRMTTATYALKEISSNHIIAATFAVRTQKVTVIGKQVSACAVGQLCAVLCSIDLPCPVKPDSISFTATYNSTYTISTINVSGISVFQNWRKNGSALPFSTAINAVTDPVTADVVYRAAYLTSIIVDPCLPSCVVQPPVVMPGQIGSTSEPTLSKEPDPN